MRDDGDSLKPSSLIFIHVEIAFYLIYSCVLPRTSAQIMNVSPPVSLS